MVLARPGSPHKKALSSKSNHFPQPSISHTNSPLPPLVTHHQSQYHAMNNSVSLSNDDEVASATWPDPLGAMGDYPYYSYIPVPQDAYPGVSAPSTAGSYIPDFDAADDAAFSLAPTTEMGAFGNLPTQVDFTSHQVSSQCVGNLTWTYPAVPQNILDSWSTPDLCTFNSCICHHPSYSPDANPSPRLQRRR